MGRGVGYVCVQVWSKRGRCEKRKTRALTVKTAGDLRNVSLSLGLRELPV